MNKFHLQINNITAARLILIQYSEFTWILTVTTSTVIIEILGEFFLFPNNRIP